MLDKPLSEAQAEFTAFEEHVTARFTKPETGAGRLKHAALGIVTEIGELLDPVKANWIYNRELNRENLVEEGGDILFYVVAAGLQMEIPMQEIVFFTHGITRARDLDDVLVSGGRASSAAGALLTNAVKQAVGVRVLLAEILANTLRVLAFYSITLEEIMAHNVAKLAKRYPLGFTEAAANARADKAQ